MTPPHPGIFERRKTQWRLLALFSILYTIFNYIPAVAADKTAADYFVHSLPGQPDGPLLRMHAGHIEVTPEHNGNLFFWHYQNQHIADRSRTVIWLNGGPGCSSEDGGLMELGPYRVGEGGKLQYNNGSWDQFANLLFVDNPVGTGFSYVDGNAYTHELQEMSDQFVVFLEKFFALFPEYEQDEIYIAGESYAGQYIPYIAKTIVDRNTRLGATDSHRWNLAGLLIGNGWISPIDHYMSYTTFAYESGLIQGGTKEAEKVEKSLSDCLNVIGKPEAQDQITVGVCEGILSRILDVTQSDGRCPNMYDVRLTDTFPACGMNWPPDLETVTPYLRRQDVIEALHINKEKREGWSECSGAVSSNFRAVNSKPSVQLLPGLLESGLPILLFSGDKDMICNHIGTEEMIKKMKWNGGTGFELSTGGSAPQQDWSYENEPAGIYQEARNLTYVKVFNSSHMVPFDYSARSRDMLNRFMGLDESYLAGDPISSTPSGGGQSTTPDNQPNTNKNSTLSHEEEKENLRKAELKAYYRSGEAALVVVVIAASIFGWWVWRQRRQNRGWNKNNEGGLGSYMSVPGVQSLTGLNSSGGGKGKGRNGDIEAGDFDEAELDNLQRNGRPVGAVIAEHGTYDLASDSDEDDDVDIDIERKGGGGGGR